MFYWFACFFARFNRVLFLPLDFEFIFSFTFSHWISNDGESSADDKFMFVQPLVTKLSYLLCSVCQLGLTKEGIGICQSSSAYFRSYENDWASLSTLAICGTVGCAVLVDQRQWYSWGKSYWRTVWTRCYPEEYGRCDYGWGWLKTRQRISWSSALIFRAVGTDRSYVAQWVWESLGQVWAIGPFIDVFLWFWPEGSHLSNYLR